MKGKEFWNKNIVLFAFLLFAMNTSAQRERLNFDTDWKFHKGDIAMKRAVKAGKQGGITDANIKVVTGEEVVIAYSDKNKVINYKPDDWETIKLPHDWLVEEPFVYDNTLGSSPAANGYRLPGIGFYRKEFEIPAEDRGKKISIEFDGIFRNSTVWVNGHLLGSHSSGYIPSYYDLTDVLRYGTEGKNVILVKVDATDYEGWWYEGCGIYRHTWLIKTNRMHVARFGTFVTTSDVSEKEAVVRMETCIRNDYDSSKNVILLSRIVDKYGKVLTVDSTAVRIAGLNQETVQQEKRIQYPKLWTPETPELYVLQTEIKDNGEIVDRLETTFGIRTFAITEKGFFLNGKHYPIKGTANHQDFAGVGVAVPDKINEYRVRLLKEMGCNAYRSAHNPPTPELLNICDSLGMLVLDENRLLSSSEEGLNDLATLIYRDRNHPSVFMWCAENEESLEGTVTGTRILQTMVNTIRKIDPTRPITAGMNHGWNEGGYSSVVDVVGYNYGQRGMQYVKDYEKYPKRKMIVTESTSYVSTRGEYEDNKEKGYVSNFGKGISWGMQPGTDWEHIVKYPFLSGMFAWTGFDYRGEPTPYQWPCVTSHFGIMDLCGFPKDGYYAYKAAWRKEPLVHVFPHWNWDGKKGEPIKVGAYTNCEELELFVNGKSQGRKKVIPYHKTEWNVKYVPGKLEVMGYIGEKVVAKDVVETTQKAAGVQLKSNVYSLKADGCDVAVVNVAIVDGKGRVVPTADNLVKFSLEGAGEIIGVGNGNPSSHESDKAGERKAFNGYCQVLIQASSLKGTVRLVAMSDELSKDELVITVK